MLVVRPSPRHSPLLLTVRHCSSETFLQINKRPHAKDSTKIEHVTKKRGIKGEKVEGPWVQKVSMVGETGEVAAMGWGGAQKGQVGGLWAYMAGTHGHGSIWLHGFRGLGWPGMLVHGCNGPGWHGSKLFDIALRSVQFCLTCKRVI